MQRLLKVSNVVWKYKVAIIAATSTITAVGFKKWANRPFHPQRDSPTFRHWKKISEQPIPIESIPKREDQLKQLRGGKNYDVLVIGGGATGFLFFFFYTQSFAFYFLFFFFFVLLSFLFANSQFIFYINKNESMKQKKK